MKLRGIAMFVLAGELAARLAAPGPQQWRWPQTRFEAHRSLGFRMRPNQESFSADQPFRTNALGLRGRAVAAPKPAGSRRILILGDSIASGYGVAEDETFARRLESTLEVEVINAGVPSYNTAQEVSYLEEYGLALEPDVVVVALYWNDIHDKSGIAVDGEGRLVETIPGSGAGALRSARAYRVRNWLKQSRLAYLMVDRLRGLEMWARPPIQRETQMAVLEGAAHPRVEQGWRSVESHLARLGRIAEARGFRPLVMILPMPQQLGGRFPGVRYQSVVREMCAWHGLAWLDLEPAFARAQSAGARLFLPYDGDHPNAAGHALIAEQLRRAL